MRLALAAGVLGALGVVAGGIVLFLNASASEPMVGELISVAVAVGGAALIAIASSLLLDDTSGGDADRQLAPVRVRIRY